MKNTLLLSIVAAGMMMLCAAGIGNAQNTVTPRQRAASYASLQNDYNGEVTAEQVSSNPTVLVGCLDRGPGANEYTLYGEFPNIWEVKSDSIALEAYVGQTIRVIALKRSAGDRIYLVTDVPLVVMTTCMQ